MRVSWQTSRLNGYIYIWYILYVHRGTCLRRVSGPDPTIDLHTLRMCAKKNNLLLW